MHWGSKRVAQAAPDPAPAGADQPPADGSAPPAADPAQPPPNPAPAAAPATVDTTPNLSDEELKKLAEQEAKEEVITVTGSTIERKTLTTPAPLTILNRDDLNAAGRSTVGDILQSLPAQSNAINAQANNGGDGSTRVDIRGLGTARTLTLLNGRRIVPGGTGADASVDLNAIPLAVIERVEVLKDGASAVYGSDAIGGVVNIITRTDFDGTEANLYSGVAQRGDGFTYDASFVTGHNAENKKGNIIFSAGIQSQDSVFAGERSFSAFDKTFDFKTGLETKSGSPNIPGGRIATRTITNGTDFNGDGKPDGKNLCGLVTTHDPDPVKDAANFGKPIALCTSDGRGGYRPYTAPADLYNFQPVNYLYTPSSRYNVYSAGTYKLLPEVSTFFEASYLNRTSDQQLAPEPFAEAATISKDSIYNKLGGDVVQYRRRLEEFGPRRSLQNVDTFRIVAGVQGSVPDDAAALRNWKWELSYNYGRTDAILKGEGNLILSHLTQALGPSFIDGVTGKPTCGTVDAPIAGCVPMDILGPSGSIDPAAKAYTTFTGISSGYNEQQTVLAQAHGRIAKLPNNGDLSIAVGTDYRKEAGGSSPDPLTATGDTTAPSSAPTDGTYNVAEGFGEISLVPISGQKYAEWVELNLAARAFHYNNFGNGVTWKAGGLFRTINGIAVRGTYSTAFRAPSVAELFQGQAEGFPPAVDPCDTAPNGKSITLPENVASRCMAQGVAADFVDGSQQQKSIGGGNKKLKAERAKVFTAGIVLEPPQAKGLALTVDYWNVDITKAIQSLGASAILSNCYNHGLESYCDQIKRDPARGFVIDFIDDPTQNIGGTTTSGLDAAVVYDHKFGDAGRFREQIEAQYLFKYNLDTVGQVFHGRDNYDLGVYPKYKANLAVSWQHKAGVGAGANLRYVGSFKECANNDCNGGEIARDVAAWYKVDLFGSYTFKNAAGHTTVSVGVNNVADQKPSLIYIGFAGDSDSSTYDYMGRFFYGRVSHLF